MILEGGIIVDPAAGVVHEQPISWGGSTFGISSGPSLDARGGLVLPGFVCGHVELGSAFVPGFPLVPKRCLDAMDVDDLYAAVRLSAMNAALAGATTVFDMWNGALIDGALDVIARAVGEIGIRAVLSVAVDDSRPQAIEENIRFEKKLSLAHWREEKREDASTDPERFRAAMAISEPDLIDGVLLEAAAAARKNEMPMHVMLRGEAASRRRIAERGGFRSGSLAVFAQGVEIPDEERALLRDLHTWVVIRPREGAFAGLRGISQRAVLGGRGADASPLDDRIALRAMGADAPAALAATATLPHALAAETFDVPFGRFGHGAPADFVVIDPPLPAPANDMTISAHLDAIDAGHVRAVVVAGEVIVRDRVPAWVDPIEVRAKAREALSRVWTKALR